MLSTPTRHRVGAGGVTEEAVDAVRTLIRGLGEDVGREGIQDTPMVRRIALRRDRGVAVVDLGP